MKTFVRLALASVLLLPPFVSAQTDGKDWLNGADDAFYAEHPEDVSKDRFFEVADAKLPEVLAHDLKDVHFVAIDDSIAQSYKGSAFHCTAGLHPFLLRAVRGHRGTGAFQVAQTDQSILIKHGSLGRTTQYNKTALVACLHNAPDAVYIAVSIAE